jgi:hypothetical protein
VSRTSEHARRRKVAKVIQRLWFAKDIEAAIGFCTFLIPGSSVA